MSPFLAYRYEELRDMVNADDPERIEKYATEWYRLSNAMSTFATMLHSELGVLSKAYSSVDGAPALISRMRENLDTMVQSAERFMRNSVVLNNAAVALKKAKEEMAAIAPKKGEAVIRHDKFHDELSAQARPIVEALADAYQTSAELLTTQKGTAFNAR